jgi:hypothetical protein
VHPRKEIAVGYKAKAAQASERLSRSITESATAALYHRVQMVEPPAAPLTSGTLHDGGSGGGLVEGGYTERVAAEESGQPEEK